MPKKKSASMKRAHIIVKGKVQRVGYRDVVQEIARGMSVTGFVRNVLPYDVEIVAEAEQEDLERFIELIRVQAYPISVEDMETTYQDATDEFDYMEIKRGEWGEELAERFDVASHRLTDIKRDTSRSVEIGEVMLDKQDRTISSIENLRTDILGKQDQTIGSIEHLRGDVGQRFDKLDDKYGEINRNLVNVIEKIEMLLEKSDRDREVFKNTMERLLNELIAARTNRPV